MLRKTLLACGALSSLLYIGADVVASLVYPDYHSFTAQAISELTANGAPTKGLIAGPFSDMNLRGSEWMLTDTLHIAATVVIVLCIFGGVMFATSALGRGFFRYSIGTLITLAVFGVIAGLQGVRLAVGEPTPWFGVVERIHIGAYLLWMFILAATVWPGRHAS